MNHYYNEFTHNNRIKATAKSAAPYARRYINRKQIMKVKILAFISLLIATNAHAWSVVGPAKITFLENGWFGEGIAIHLDKGVAGCNSADNDFALSADHPSYKEIIAFATSAFMSSSNIELVVEEGVCIFGDRTKILSIRLVK